MQSTATVAEWAREIGFDRNTLMGRVVEMNLQTAGKVVGGKAAGADLYKIRDLFKAALGGDYEAEKLRKTREEADRLAIQNARSRGETIEVDLVKKLGQAIFIIIRNKILNFPITKDEQDSLLLELLRLKEVDWEAEALRANK